MLYFQRPLRPLVGMRNTLVDMMFHKFEYNIMDYPNLWFVRANYNKILYEFEKGVADAKKHYFHKLCLLYTSPSPRDRTRSRMPSSA